jgi:hypothetical protein
VSRRAVLQRTAVPYCFALPVPCCSAQQCRTAVRSECRAAAHSRAVLPRAARAVLQRTAVPYCLALPVPCCSAQQCRTASRGPCLMQCTADTPMTMLTVTTDACSTPLTTPVWVSLPEVCYLQQAHTGLNGSCKMTDNSVRLTTYTLPQTEYVHWAKCLRITPNALIQRLTLPLTLTEQPSDHAVAVLLPNTSTELGTFRLQLSI